MTALGGDDEVWIAADCSGSVGCGKYSSRYFSELSVVNQEPCRVRIMWDGACREVDAAEMTNWIQNKKGFGGTRPSVLASLIKTRNFHGVLRLFTDGHVPLSEVELCDQILHGDSLENGTEGYVFSRVEVFIVETQMEANMSVSMPFTRFSPFVLKHVKISYQSPVYRKVTRENISIFEDFVRRQGDPNFEGVAEKVVEVAEARFMGTRGSPAVRDAAIYAKNALTRYMSQNLSKDRVGERLLSILESTEDRSQEALLESRSMIKEYLSVKQGNPAMKVLDRIIGLCEGKARKCFTKEECLAAISTVEQRARDAPEPAETLPLAEELPEETPTSDWFQCPVTLEDSTANMVITLAWSEGVRGRCFLDSVDPDFKKLLFKNPLWLWLRQDYVDNFATVLDDLLSCEALRNARVSRAPIKISPTTRRPLAAAFPLSSSSEDHEKARRWALCRAVSGGKVWGNPDLWFVNLALVVERKKVSKKLQKALPLILGCLREQLRSRTTYASLSGNPELPMTKVPVSVAFFLVVCGPLYDFPKMTLELLPLASHLVWVVRDLMRYRLPQGWELALSRMKISQSMRDWKVKDRNRLDNCIVALVQKCLRFREDQLESLLQKLPDHYQIVEFVELDGEAGVEQRTAALDALPPSYKQHAQDYGWEDLVAISRFVKPSQGPLEAVPPGQLSLQGLEARVSWPSYGLRQYKRSLVPVCSSTARPLSVLNNGRSGWKEEAMSFYGFPPEPGETLSAHEHFGRFVGKHGFYPSAEELCIYLRQTYVVSGKKDTLPFLLEQFVDEVLESNQPLTSVISPQEYSFRFEKSRNLRNRSLLENEVCAE